MPEWLTTDNIAIGVLLAAVGVLLAAIKALANEVKAREGSEKAALLQGIEMGNGRIAEIQSISSVMSALQRATRQMAVEQKGHHDSVIESNRRLAKAVVAAVRQELQKHVGSSGS